MINRLPMSRVSGRESGIFGADSVGKQMMFDMTCLPRVLE